MKIGPKYKIARRLGAAVFDKTQTQKYDLALQKKGQQRRTGRRPKQLSQYGVQLREKQKARYSYLVPEKQFANYVKAAMSTNAGTPADQLYQRLEMRLDNVAHRLGLAPTKTAARQLVSHGHVHVNGRRNNIASHGVSVGDVISIREQSKNTKLFDNLKERLENYNPPAWLSFDENSLTGKVEGRPQLKGADLLFDIQAILEFYSR
ncbi:MAG: 30S ribosomal protein S4 [Candidatus Paceibacterota bacterium]